MKQQIVALETQEMVWALKRSQQKVFEGSNKPGKYLAYILKKKKQSRIINKISDQGKEIGDKAGIKASFLKFYSGLYKGKNMDLDKLQNYFHKYNIKKLKDEEKNLREEPITTEEIEAAIDWTKTEKAPGPDGFTAKFYKKFKDEITYWLQEVSNDILKGEAVPQT